MDDRIELSLSDEKIAQDYFCTGSAIASVMRDVRESARAPVAATVKEAVAAPRSAPPDAHVAAHRDAVIEAPVHVHRTAGEFAEAGAAIRGGEAGKQPCVVEDALPGAGQSCPPRARRLTAWCGDRHAYAHAR